LGKDEPESAHGKPVNRQVRMRAAIERLKHATRGVGRLSQPIS
jgi:hypothetical protein